MMTVKKNVLTIVFIILILPIHAKELTLKGYPTGIQTLDNNSILLMLNDDYDFSFYKISYDKKITIDELHGLTKRDINDDYFERKDFYEKKYAKDEKMISAVQKEIKKQQKRYSKKRGFQVNLYSSPTFYEKKPDRTVCILSLEDGDYVYDSLLFVLTENKTKIKKLKNKNVIFCSNSASDDGIIIYYRFDKDKTYITTLKEWL